MSEFIDSILAVDTGDISIKSEMRDHMQYEIEKMADRFKECAQRIQFHLDEIEGEKRIQRKNQAFIAEYTKLLELYK